MPKRCRFSSRRHGFTLVELLVVIGIIAVLISILLPALAKARDRAQRTTCASNLRQICLIAMMYANDNRGHFPYILVNDPNGFANGGGPDGRQLWQSYVKDPSVFYCPGNDAGLLPVRPNDGSMIASSPAVVGWTVYPISATSPNNPGSAAVVADYHFFACANDWGTTKLNRVHVLLGMYDPITNVANFGDSSPAISDRTDAANATETPFAADWTISRNIPTGAGASSLTALAHDPFTGYRSGRGDTTEISNHFAYGFLGLNVAFFDGHVEWRTNTEAGPRLSMNFTSNYPPSDYGWVFWY